MASKRLQRRKQCTGKIKYKKPHEASYVVNNKPHLLLHTYKCKFCGSFHVGRKSLEYERRQDDR